MRLQVKSDIRKYRLFFFQAKGCTKLVELTIDTGTNRPITSRLRLLAPLKIEEVRLQVQEMLHEHIIEPSASPWSSAVVLV